VRWLQNAVGVAEDGDIGPVTISAITAKSGQGAALLSEFLAQRMNFMAGLATWKTFGLGWARRLCALPFSAMQMGTPPS
jgi:lysozyme family protein